MNKTLDPLIFCCCLWAMVLIVIGCGETPNTQTAENIPKAFFDVKAFIEAEAEALSQSKQRLKKSVHLGEQNENKEIETPDWTSELKLFADSDINKTAWIDKFEVDTLSDRIVYKCLSPKIKTQQIDLLLNAQKEIYGMEIENQTGNVLYQSQESLKYDKAQRKYSILRTQKVLFRGDEQIEILGEF